MPRVSGSYYALGAALLWGGTIPLVKSVLASSSEAHEIEYAGLLYAAAAAGLLLVRLIRTRTAAPEVSLSRRDLAYLAATIATGGVVAPILLLWGLGRASGLAASLLLNIELPATAAFAVLLCRERIGVRTALGMSLVLFGGLTIALGQDAGGTSTLLGACAITGACLGWALDNNLTTRIAHLDPLRVAMLKGAAAAPVSLALAFALTGRPVWETPYAARSLLLVGAAGFVGYGLGLAAFVRALRELGAARTGALFATAPFISAVASILVLSERPTVGLAAAGGFMAMGVRTIVADRNP